MSDLPPPPVPADVDLRGMSFMPLDVVRLLDSDLFALSTGDEFKAAVALWAKGWLQVPAASLPDDDRVLAHLSCAGTKWKRVKDMALRGWVKCSDGRYYHPVVAEKALEAWKHRLNQRARAAKRWDKHNNSDGTATAHATAYPEASPTAMQGTGTGTGIEKIPPIAPQGGQDETPDPLEIPEFLDRRPKNQRGTRLLLETLPEDWRQFALNEGHQSPEREFQQFRDFWIAKPGQGGVKLDWLATWRNWIRNNLARGTGGGQRAKPGNGFIAVARELAGESP